MLRDLAGLVPYLKVPLTGAVLLLAWVLLACLVINLVLTWTGAKGKDGHPRSVPLTGQEPLLIAAFALLIFAVR